MLVASASLEKANQTVRSSSRYVTIRLSRSSMLRSDARSFARRDAVRSACYGLSAYEHGQVQASHRAHVARHETNDAGDAGCRA